MTQIKLTPDESLALWQLFEELFKLIQPVFVVEQRGLGHCQTLALVIRALREQYMYTASFADQDKGDYINPRLETHL